MTLRLFEQLLQKPCQHVLQNLVLRNLEERNYIEYKAQEEREEREHMENGQPHDSVYERFVHIFGMFVLGQIHFFTH